MSGLRERYRERAGAMLSGRPSCLGASRGFAGRGDMVKGG